MSDGIKIPVGVDIGQLNAGTDQAEKRIEKLGKTIDRVNQKKINPIDEKGLESNLGRLEKRFEVFVQRIEEQLKKVNGGSIGGAGAGAAGVPALLPPSPVPAGGRRPPVGRYRYTNAPEWGSVPSSLIGGFGGGLGHISQYGMRGARAGMRDAESGGGSGMLGGAMGLLRGLGIGALAFGALKAGAGASEGMDMARSRAMSVDTLKRKLGDLGISFDSLRSMSEAAASGLGINSKEAADLALQFSKLSRGAEHGMALAGAVRSGVGISRAYGLDPSDGVGFLARMQNINPHQNNRELALLLAQAIERSGMGAQAGEVMQAIQSFAAVTSRMSLSAPNIAAYGGAYSSLMGAGYTGMTSDVAASILGQANSSMMHMGSAGEGGQNFILSAMMRNGAINPIAARALAQGGLFASRRGVFGRDRSGRPSALRSYLGDSEADKLSGGAGADVMNIDAVRSHLDRQGMDKWTKLDAFSNLYGLSSYGQAAALYKMDTHQLGGLQRSLEEAGVKVGSLSETGIAGLAHIGAAGTHRELTNIAREYMGRTGRGSLSAEEKEQLAHANGGGTEDLRKALIRIAATKDQEETEGSKMRDQVARISDVQISVGDKLLVPLNSMKDALLYMAGGGQKTQQQVITDMANLEFSKRVTPLQERRSKLQTRLAGDLSTTSSWFNNKSDADKAKILAERAAVQRQIGSIDSDVEQLGAERAKRIATFDMGGTAGANVASKKEQIEAVEKKYGLKPGTLLGMWGAESSYGSNPKAFVENSAGAMGNFGFQKPTAARYGVTRGNFDSELDGAGHYMADLMRKHHGSLPKALGEYNGAVSPGKMEDYVSRVEKYGQMSVDDAPAQMPTAAKGAGAAHDQITVNVNLGGHIPGPNGQSTPVSVQTAVPLPRGSGSRSIDLAAR